MSEGQGQLTLAIETSNPSAARGDSGPGVAAGLVRPDGAVEVLGVEILRSSGRHDDDLMPAIDRLWGRLGRARSSIERVAVSLGPGGYTGLRVAVVTAKLIAEAVGAGCVGVPSAAVVARRVSPKLALPFGVALASKGQTTVVTVFERAISRGGPPREMDAEAIAGLGLRALVADHHLPPEIRERCSQLGMVVEPPRFDPAACLEASAALEAVDPARLAPLYGREPEAVRKWRELHGPAGGR